MSSNEFPGEGVPANAASIRATTSWFGITIELSDAVGPTRVATFITGDMDDDLQADVVGFVSRLVAKVRER